MAHSKKQKNRDVRTNWARSIQGVHFLFTTLVALRNGRNYYAELVKKRIFCECNIEPESNSTAIKC